MLVDSFGRIATDLRVSLIDKCNLRCAYCMPPEGLPWLPRQAFGGMQYAQRRLHLSMRETRRSVAILPNESTSIRPAYAPGRAALAEAGLDRVNVSLDTLDPARFRQITFRDKHADVLAGLAAARAAGLEPVKVNTVLLRGVNDDEAPALLHWALANGYQLRFIEQMPLDAQHGWTREAMVTADEVLVRLQGTYELAPVSDPDRGAAPAETWQVLEGPGRAEWVEARPKVGIVGSVTRPFCAACDRVRLTADGQLRNCLFATTESDLRTAMRAGADDAELARRFVASAGSKKAGHGIGDPGFQQPDRPMSAIGG